MAKLGVTAINMYCDMIKESFNPILAELNSREYDIKEEVETMVKKDVGIYDLYVKHARLKLEIKEIERKLKGWEVSNHTPMGWLNPIDERVEVIMRKQRNGLRKEVEKELNDLIYAVKLSGLDSDTKSVFEKLPKIVESLAKKVNKLPPPNVKKLLK